MMDSQSLSCDRGDKNNCPRWFLCVEAAGRAKEGKGRGRGKKGTCVTGQGRNWNGEKRKGTRGEKKKGMGGELWDEEWN